MMPGPDASEGSATVVASARPIDGGRSGDAGGGAGVEARSGAGSSGKASQSPLGFGFSAKASAVGETAKASTAAASPIRTHAHPYIGRSFIPSYKYP